MPRFGTKELLLASALAVTGAAEAQEPASSPKDGMSLQTTPVSELEDIRFIVRNDTLSSKPTPKHLADITEHGFHYYLGDSIYSSAGPTFIVFDRVYKFDNMVEGTMVMSPLREEDGVTCLAATEYVDQINRGGEIYYVISPANIQTVQCPEDALSPNKGEATVYPLEPLGLDEDELPKEQNFFNVNPEVVKSARIILPNKLGLKESDLDPKLDTPNNLIVRNAKGVHVYEKYDLVEYDESNGRMVVVRAGEEKSKTQECKVSIIYTDTFVKDGQRYFVFPDDFRTATLTCEQAVHSPASLAEVPEESQEAKPKKTEFKPELSAGLMAGVDMEETSTANLGQSVAGLGFVVAQPFNSVPVAAGISAEGIFSEAGSGVEGVNGAIGYKGNRLAAYLTVGSSFEPRKPGSALDGALSVGTLVQGTILQKGPWNVDCGVTAELHLYGGGALPLNVAALCGVSREFIITMEPKPQDNPVPVVPETVQAPKAPLTITVKDKVPSEGPRKAPKWKGEAPSADARFYDSRTALERNLMGYNKFGVNIPAGSYLPAYRAFLTMEESGYNLTADDFINGASAARGLGNVTEMQRILETGIAVYPDNQKIKQWLDSYYPNYSWLQLTVPEDASKLTVEFLGDSFDPAVRAALAYLNEKVLTTPGKYQLSLPNGEYVIGGEHFIIQESKTVVIKIKETSER